MHWMFTGVLIGASGATAVYTLWLVRRLFTTPPPARPEAAAVAHPALDTARAGTGPAGDSGEGS
ncbi:MAG TPA: hypothetical protein VF667_07700 [Pseudonocardia sp.]